MRRILILIAISFILTGCGGAYTRAYPELATDGAVSAAITEIGGGSATVDGDELAKLLDNLARMCVSERPRSDLTLDDLSSSMLEPTKITDGWLIELEDGSGETLEKIYVSSHSMTCGDGSFIVHEYSYLKKQLQRLTYESTEHPIAELVEK